MKKYKGYCYQVKKSDVVSRNGNTALQLYEWHICIWNKKTKGYDVLQSSSEDCESKGDAVNAAIDHIDEYYYQPPPKTLTMSSTTFNEEKNCPAYFKYEGKVYQCVGNDDNQFWAIIDDESKGFEQSNCIVLQVKKDFNVTHLSFGSPILVNGELCTVDHIKPFDFSSTVKDGFVIVFDSENGILETEESDIIKIFEDTRTPSKELIHEYFDNCSTRTAASIESKELKSTEYIAKELFFKHAVNNDVRDGSYYLKFYDFMMALDEYASQLHPVSNSEGDKPQILEQCRQYAESKMPVGWDRKYHIDLGVFYKHFVDKLYDLSAPSPTPDVTEAVFGDEFMKWADENELTKQSGGNLAISIINQFINSKTKNNEQQ